jgi:TonB family protein
VLLHIQLNATGHVEAAGVVQVSGFALLDEAALKAVRAWEFEAAHRLGSGSAGAVPAEPFETRAKCNGAPRIARHAFR